MKLKKTIALITALSLTAACVPFISACGGSNEGELLAHYSFDENGGTAAKESVSGKDYKIRYVFSDDVTDAEKVFKEKSDPLRKKGVKGNSLYMDGFSTYVTNNDLKINSSAVTFSAWVAPRVFENVVNYSDSSDARGHTRLTAVLNKGDMEMCEGFTFGYGRLGLWGAQFALRDETDNEFVVGYYDPVNSLPLYEWSHLSVSFDGTEGYIGLFYNGETAYEAIIPELKNTKIISSAEPLYVGRYTNPMVEFSVDRQMPAGLLDEVKIYGESLSPAQVENVYKDVDGEGHPALDWKDVALDSSVYEGDCYRPQYHAIPPAVWMNEPHSPFYYKGKYHVFYQHNPSGPYWSQIRWAHIVSDDMIHWEYVKDAVVPTEGICPEGVWTGGACIGPDGTPWLAITAGTNKVGVDGSGQNVAFAHAANPDDPYLTDWIVEDKVAITQPAGGVQGERDQFRDPFVWYDDGIYYMMVSTSIPGRGGSANVYTSTDMREWEYKGYLFDCDYECVPEQGAHWECVVMLPISTKDGTQTKYILFDCPQYTVDGYVVDCYYWIGTFDKATCKFIPDENPEAVKEYNDYVAAGNTDPRELHKLEVRKTQAPRLFDRGYGIYTGQNGFCYLTEEDIAAGKTEYTQGRTVIYSIAQGKDAGTAQNKQAGWAHNFAIPLELYLSDDGKEVIREPIKELESIRTETLYDYSGSGKTASEINAEIKDIRGDMLEIRASFTLEPSSEVYSGGINVRYNPNTVNLQTEHTDITFSQKGVYIARTQSSLLSYVKKDDSSTWINTERSYDVIILLDRSMLEVYVNGVMSFTTRIYPKYGDSDYIKVFDTNAGIKFNKFTVYRMGSAYTQTVTPPYYGDTGNLGDL
ncbi:MAG: GH32 C-terminal domain-containing protein [Clostridia bacterium]|nr:GH32 C-terminal domain-containing protein [Clostridia bacterium]